MWSCAWRGVATLWLLSSRFIRYVNPALIRNCVNIPGLLANSERHGMLLRLLPR